MCSEKSPKEFGYKNEILALDYLGIIPIDFKYGLTSTIFHDLVLSVMPDYQTELCDSFFFFNCSEECIWIEHSTSFSKKFCFSVASKTMYHLNLFFFNVINTTWCFQLQEL